MKNFTVGKIYSGKWVMKNASGETILPVRNGEVLFEFGFDTKEEAEAALDNLQADRNHPQHGTFNTMWRFIWDNGVSVQTGCRDIKEYGPVRACLDDDGSTKVLLAKGLNVYQDYNDNLVYIDGDFEVLVRIESVLHLLNKGPLC